MTSWAASSGDPFDAVRKFFQDLQDSWSQPRSAQSERHHGSGRDNGDDEAGRHDDRWESSRDDRPRDGEGPRRGAGPRRGPAPGQRPGSPFGPGFAGAWGPWGGGRSGNPFGWPGGSGRGGWQGGPGKGWPGGPGKGWMGGQRGPRAGRGDVRLAILALLAEQPMHGYQLIQEISRRSAGVWKPSPGSVYPTLQQLEDEGLVHAQEREGKRVYSLTDDGRAFADDRTAEFASMWDAYQPDDDDAALGDLVFGVASAFVHVMRTGSDRQIAAARSVLARTRADLYKILGDDPDAGSTHTDTGSQHADSGEGDNGESGRSDADSTGSGDGSGEAGDVTDEWGDERS